MRLVDEGVLTLGQLVRAMALNPARIVGIGKGTLSPGSDADIAILDTRNTYTVTPGDWKSKGKNTPFEGWTLHARPVATVVRGRIYQWE